MTPSQAEDKNLFNYRFRRNIMLGGIVFLILGLLFLGFLWLRNRSSEPREAPEAERVLNAQMEMPFQVLIPAFLPRDFIRTEAEITVDKAGPQGEPMVQIVYPTRHGASLTFYEWLPSTQSTGIRKASYCKCVCLSQGNCESTELGFTVGSLRVMSKVSTPDIMTAEEARSVLDTLGPAANRQIYTSLKDVPITFSVSPAVDVPINSDGIQEVTLVVTPNGYSPDHFAVRKGIPVKLIFRQTGQVGCGNELIFRWGDDKTASLILTSTNDIQSLEFTPTEIGDFRFNCPHLIYRGVMTVGE